MSQQLYKISAPALHAARTLLQHYEVDRKTCSRVEPTVENIATLIDVCTQVFRCQDSLTKMLKKVSWRGPMEAEDLRCIEEAMHVMALVRQNMPQSKLSLTEVGEATEKAQDAISLNTQKQRQYEATHG